MELFQSGFMGALLVASASVLGAAGELDDSFGTDGDGKVRIPFDLGGNAADTPRSMALDPDGNIVVGGSASTDSGFKMAIARLKADGLPDYSFDVGNSNYKQTYSVSNLSATGNALVATSNGPCLAGSNNGAFGSVTAHIACFVADQVTTHFANLSEQIFSWSAAISNSWTIVGNDFFYVAGPMGTGVNEDSVVARMQLSPGGLSPDSTFGSGGYMSPAFSIRIKATRLAENLGLYIAGCDTVGDQDFVVGKILPSGDPDATFDSDGVSNQVFDLDGAFNDCAAAMVLDSENRAVVAGMAARDENGVDTDIALTRLWPSGAQDTSFGPGGKRTYSFSTADPTLKDEVAGVAIDSLGRIYVVGTLHHANAQDDVSDVALLRLKPNGEIDTSFGTEGRALFSAPYDGGCALPPVSAEKGVAIVIQDSKPVILAERRACNSDTDFMVMRLLPGDGLFADGFEGP
jgi:uncharacterized delta-60 repeat protein